MLFNDLETGNSKSPKELQVLLLTCLTEKFFIPELKSLKNSAILFETWSFIESFFTSTIQT